jgi:hypothetical protein
MKRNGGEIAEEGEERGEWSAHTMVNGISELNVLVFISSLHG